MNNIYFLAQPNAGKTTLFNRISGKECYVANWPGKTVEVHQAKIVHHGKEIILTDLPGINSFKTASREEEITKEFIFRDAEGVTVIVVNGESLFRSLYFAVQVLELKSNAVVVINKLDSLERKGIHINSEALSNKLGVDVILISAVKGIGLNQLLDRCMDILEGRSRSRKLKIDYGSIEKFVERAEKITGDRGIAVKALEGDELAISLLSDDARIELKKIHEEIANSYGNPEEIIAMQRYRFVEDLLKNSVREVRVSRSSWKRLDAVFFSKAGPFLAIAMLFLTIFASLSVNTGFPVNVILRIAGMDDLAELIESYSLVGMISGAFDEFSEFLGEILPDSILKSLLVEGIIPGIGVIASFFPLILILNFIMSLLEDSGLMARFAIAMDRLFSAFGLTGKSMFPFSISIACNVPGAMTARILETDSERIRVALATPFVVCQARLLVLVLFAAFLFTSPLLQASAVVLIYLISAMLFLMATRVYGKAIKLETSDLLIELPPYHFPNLRVSWWITWHRSKAFVFKVGKFLLFFSILLWILNFFDLGIFAGQLISSAFQPFGFGPEIGFALLMGFFAKELIISSLAISYGTTDVSELLSMLNLSIPQALALIVFISFYTPCAATVSTVYAEIRSAKLLVISIAFQLLLAYLLALVVYFIGNQIGFSAFF